MPNDPRAGGPDIVEVRSDDPLLVPLLRAAEAELRRRYPEDDDLGPELDVARWLVARRDGAPVGSIALCRLEHPAGEIKRMYVPEPVRRTGVARALLAAVESAARHDGLRVLRLETGTRQPEAMALYAACGYRPIPDYGYWAGHPLSRCYEKSLQP